MSLNIRDRQIAALKHMLNLNVPLKGKANEPVWKVRVHWKMKQYSIDVNILNVCVHHIN